MEAPHSALLGAMGSLLKKLELRPTEDTTQQQLRDEAKELKEDVDIIRTKLERLSEVHDPPLTVNYWKKDARELSYDMEDFVDQVVQLGGADAQTGCVDQIKGFKARMEQLKERYDRYKLQEFLTQTTNTRLPMVYGREPEPGDLVGMDKSADEILRELKVEGEEELKVVSILGYDGIGKTTLARKLWRELEGDFECRAFVQTTKKPDMRMILRSILSQIQPKQQPEACQIPNLIRDIRKHLQDKRYFIIIDDLWAVSVWDVVSRAFPEGNCCRRIITTTTVEDVALACCSYDPEYILKMKPLSEDLSKKLLLDTVTGPGKNCSPELNDVSDEITRKCGGLPLAIICIGTLIASQQDTQHQLKYVQNFLHHNFIAKSTSMGILNEVLELCYSSLPHCLKSCLLYLSVYPENYLILKEDLVKQWIAEGFFSTKEKDIAVAGSYFDKFVSLGLIQRMDINCDRKELPYAVHPVVFDFIKCKSMEDNFITIIDYSHSTVVLADKIRRLSLHFGSATYATTPESNIGLSQIHSLSFMGLFYCMPSLGEFRLVRVVILHLRSDDGDTSFSLAEIDKLLLLRYLLVRCDVTVGLPARVQCLKHLETVEIYAGVADVPSDIVQHSSLQHVRIGKKTEYRNLDQGRPVTSTEPTIRDVLNCEHLPSVQVFQLLPPICIFSRLPGWIRQLTNLRILKVVVKELGKYELDHLGKLPVLTVVSLYVRKPSRDGGVTTFHSETAPFPAIEYFKFVSSVLRLSFPKKGMPKLLRLKICFNARRGGNYNDILSGIQHLEKLKEVVASIGVATGAVETDYIAAESVLQDIIGKHPSKPMFVKGKRLVDPVDEEYDPPDIQEIQEIESLHIDIQKGSIKQPGTSGKLPPPDSSGTKPRGDFSVSRSAPPPCQQLQNNIMRRPGPDDGDMDDIMGGMNRRLQVKLEALLQEKVLLSSGIHEKYRYLLNEFIKFYYNFVGYETFNYDNIASGWMYHFLNLYYDIEDWADLFALRITSHGRANSKSPKFFGCWFHRALDTRAMLSAACANLTNFMERAQVLSSQAWLNPDEVAVPTMAQRARSRSLFVLHNRMSLISQDGIIEEVMTKLLMMGISELKIVSIIGMAGSGKTTVAAAVYQRLRREFASSIFISVASERHMIISTLKTMLLQIEMENQGSSDIFKRLEIIMDSADMLWREMGHPRSIDIRQLTRKLRESLKNKRYLIVIDDLCSREHWEIIKSCFPEDNIHSRIVITTRNDALALHCSLSDHIYKIGLLGDEDSKQLFLNKVLVGPPPQIQNKVLGTRYDSPHSLDDISPEIMKKCGGLPLAIVSVAAMLAREGSKDEWRRTGLNMLSNPDSNCLMESLNFSYNDLPPNLRICMLYLSIFPEYYEVEVELLVRLWIAEAFIVEERYRTMEETTRSYLDGLISRNMVLPLHVNHDGVPKCCTVHPVIHDFIAYKSREEDFVVIVDDQHQDVDISSGKVRRLSLQGSRNMAKNGSIDLSQARSVIIIGQANTAPSFTNLRLVRVLHLEGCDGTVCLDGLHNLQLLRYLSLKGTDVSELPETIGELSCLQTLDVRSTNVKKLPPSIVNLEKLMHLLCGNAKLPCGIAKMKALQTLSCAIVMNSSSSIIQELSELTGLRELELFYDFTEMSENDRIVKFPGDGFRRLKKLRIHCSSASVTFEPGVLPRVEILELSLDGLLDEKSTGLSGIEYLLSLKHVLLEFSQDDARAVTMVDAARNVAATVHPNHPEVTVIVDGRALITDWDAVKAGP